MSRNIWILLVAAFLVLVLMVGGLAAGFVYFRQHRAQGWLEQAEHHFEQGEWGLAKANYGLYLSKQNDDVDALRKYAHASRHLIQNRVAANRDAATAYYQISQFEPTLENMRSFLDLYEQVQSWNDLEYYANQFARQHGDSPVFDYYRALALFHLQTRPDDAAELFEKLIGEGPDYIDAYGYLALLELRRGMQQRAREVADQAVERYPDLARSYYQRARLYQELNESAAAEADLDRALELGAADSDVLVAKAQALLNRNEPEEAVELLAPVAESGVSDANVYTTLALASQRAGNIEGAIELLLNTDPLVRADAPQLYVQLAELQTFQGRVEDAGQTRQEYARAYPDHVTMHHYLEGLAYLEEGDAEGAVSKLRQVTEVAPDFPPAQYFLALALLNANERWEARTVLETYMRNYPGDAAGRVLSDLYERVFGGAETYAEDIGTAQTLLSEAAPDTARLVTTAQRLYGGAFSGEQRREAERYAVELLERAIADSPEQAQAYMVLAGIHIDDGKFDVADAVLDEGEAAGAPADAFQFLRAAIAIGQGNLARARELAFEAVASQDIRKDEVNRWANYFVRRNHLDLALDIFEHAAQGRGEAFRAGLSIEKVGLAVQAMAIPRALELLREAEALRNLDEDLQRTLNDERLRLAERLMAPGPYNDPEMAMRILARVSESNPGHARVPLMQARGLLLEQPPNRERARQILGQYLRRFPGSTEALLMLAEISAAEARDGARPEGLQEALELANRAVLNAPDAVEPKLAVAQFQIELGRSAEAQAALETVLEQNPADARAFELLMRCYDQPNSEALAQQALTRLANRIGDDPVRQERLAAVRGRMLIRQGGNLAEAERILRPLYEANPLDPELTGDLARALAGQGRLDEAVELVTELTRELPESPAAWTALADIELRRQTADAVHRASSALTRALLVSENYPPALRLMIDVHIRMNRPAEAFRLCERYLRLRPDDRQVWYQKAVLLARQPQRLDEALDETTRLLSTAGEQPEVLFLRAGIYLAMEEPAEALADLQRIEALVTNLSPEVHATMAEAYLGVGDTVQARAHLERARALASSAQSPGLENRLRQIESLLPAERGAA